MRLRKYLGLTALGIPAMLAATTPAGPSMVAGPVLVPLAI
jgi:hypothetical protein